MMIAFLKRFFPYILSSFLGVIARGNALALASNLSRQ